MLFSLKKGHTNIEWGKARNNFVGWIGDIDANMISKICMFVHVYVCIHICVYIYT